MKSLNRRKTKGVRRLTPYLSRSGGFSLVEIAIILVIVGLLAGMGAGLVGVLTKRAKLTETREIVKTAYESILGYAASNKKLPADLNALGIKTKDAYSGDLRYYRAGSFVSNNLCTSTATFLSVTDKGSVKNNVAFIIFSDSENRCNETGTSSFVISEPGAGGKCATNADAEYDDVVLYVDIDALRKQLCTSFKITTDSLPTGMEETSYSPTTLEATDGTPTYTWDLASGSLPPGLSLSSAGAISGTPTTDGSYNFTVRVTDSDNPQRIATKSLAITINPNKPRVTTEFLTYGAEGTAYPSTTLSVTGGKPSYIWSLSSGTLPPGLSLSSGGSISGTPTTAGTYSFTVRITDSGSPARTHDKTLSIAINPASSSSSSRRLYNQRASGVL
ncbi:MAG: putative Ig domain-containing protein [Nitrospirae bacterium]|nr:putative Ig domain-containing protein [Nitrospirota bacterium]